MIEKGFKNFQGGLMASPRCKGCKRRCDIVYDAHHDQYFSSVCGKVVMEMGVFGVPIFDDFDKVFQRYDEIWSGHRKKRGKG